VEGVTVFEAELRFFITNQNDLVEKHNGKVLVIRGDELVGVYDSTLEAYLEAQKQYEPGTFMIQPCAPGPEAYTVTIN
jgi:hypothetical protein